MRGTLVPSLRYFNIPSFYVCISVDFGVPHSHYNRVICFRPANTLFYIPICTHRSFSAYVMPVVACGFTRDREQTKNCHKRESLC